MTYQVASPTTAHQEDPLDLRLLQTCRQIYLEAKEVFYNRNIFSFTADFRLGTAFAFLCDRPPESLRSIRAIELALMEDNNMRATDGAHYPITSRSTDCMVLQYAYNHFTDLTTLLSTSRMNLRRLYLSVETLTHTYDTRPESFHQCMAWETARLKGSPVIASWVNPLLNIGGLESVDVCWTFTRPYIRRMANTLLLMKLHMLRNDCLCKEISGNPAEGRKIRISMCQNGVETHPETKAEELSSSHEFHWQDYSIGSDGIWESLDTDRKSSSVLQLPDTPQVQRTIRFVNGIYFCYGRLA